MPWKRLLGTTTWMKTFTTRLPALSKADTGAGAFEVIMSMMSYDAWEFLSPDSWE